MTKVDANQIISWLRNDSCYNQSSEFKRLFFKRIVIAIIPINKSARTAYHIFSFGMYRKCCRAPYNNDGFFETLAYKSFLHLDYRNKTFIAFFGSHFEVGISQVSIVSV